LIYEFKGFKPVVHESAYVHPLAAVTGNVIIGKDVYIGPGAAIRGDWGEIIIEDGCNVQENCTIHMFPGTTVLLECGAHVGHGAVIHGATLRENCLIGMNAVIMDNAEVGKNALVGALAFVPDGMIIPEASIAVGNPAKVVKEMTEERIAWKTKGTALYQQLPTDLHESLKECEPLRERPEGQQSISMDYKTWNKRKD
jgi:carbonic anhydrase/acetyltransferase-like protein (isoleucine patch superfamily)